MKLSTKLTASLIIASFVSVFTFVPSVVQAVSTDISPNVSNFAKGLASPTQNEKLWFSANSTKNSSLMLNIIGVERVNAVNKENGLSAVNNNLAVPVGKEAVSSGGVVAASANMPGSVDNSSLKYFPPIIAQGNLGACASFSTTYYLTTYMTALARNLDAKTGGDSYRFSPSWSYNMVNGGVDGGSSIEGNIELLSKNGAATISNFPISTNYLNWSTNSQTWTDALNYRLQSNGLVTDVNTAAGLSNLKQYLTNGYILSFGTYISSWKFTTIKNDPATTLDDAYVGQMAGSGVYGSIGGHAMTIVGYNDNIWIDANNNNVVDPGEKGAFKIANSWGSSWGNSGYTWLSYDSLKATSGISGVSNTNRTPSLLGYQAYWVTARTSYTPTLIAQFTVNTAKRNQLSTSLGYSETTSTVPTKTITSAALENNGGAYAFNGSLTASDATFALDYTDIISQYALDPAHNYKWYLNVTDNLSDSSILTIKDFKLIYTKLGKTISSTSTFPQTANGTLDTNAITFNLNGTTPTPAPVPIVPIVPTITSSDPVNSQTNITLDKTITINFSQNIISGTDWSKISLLNSSGISVAFTKTITGNYIEIKPTTNFNALTVYTLTIPAKAVTSSNGLSPAQNFTLKFTSMPTPKIKPIAISADAVYTVKSNSISGISITFNTPIALGATAKNIKLQYTSAGKVVVVTVTATISGNSISMISSSPLLTNLTYTLSMPNDSIKSLDGTTMDSILNIQFIISLKK